MSLKEQMDADLDTFLNPDEFAEDNATFNGTPINVLYDHVAEDNYKLDIVNCKESDVVGITASSILIVNGITYTTSSWIPRNGMMEIILNVQKWKWSKNNFAKYDRSFS